MRGRRWARWLATLKHSPSGFQSQIVQVFLLSFGPRRLYPCEHMKDGNQLLKDFVQSGDEDAFAEIVKRYVNLVYSVALRQCDQNPRQAEEVSHLVFCDLATKSKGLPSNVCLGAWLLRHCRYTAANQRRKEMRRVVREQEALAMAEQTQIEHESLEQLYPLLDEAIDKLGAADRSAIVYRYFEQQSLAEVGRMTGTSEAGAAMRIGRALEKLRKIFRRKGFALGPAGLATALSSQSFYTAAPAGLWATIASTALSKTAVSGGFWIGVINFMTMSKTKAYLVSALILTTAGIAIRERGQVLSLRREMVSLGAESEPGGKRIALGKQLNVTNEFSWRNIEDRDYRRYMENLRRLGCPWETIKDIIIADVNKIYAPRFAELQKLGEGPLGRALTPAVHARNEKLRALRNERYNILKELLGPEVYADLRDISGDSAADVQFSYLPAEKRQAASDVQAKYFELESLVYWRAHGISLSPEDAVEVKKIQADREVEMEMVLGKDDFGKYKMQSSRLALRLTHDLETFDPNEGEYVAIFKYREASESLAGQAGGRQDSGAQQDQLDSTLKNALGSARYEEYLKSQTKDYQYLWRVGQKLALPNATINSIWNLKEKAESQRSQIFSDVTLDDAARAEKLTALYKQAVAETRSKLGEDAFGVYFKQAYWLPALQYRRAPGSPRAARE